MNLSKKAQEALEQRAKRAMKASSLDGAQRIEAYHELMSHLHDAAQALAVAEGAEEVTRAHVQRATDDEAAAVVAGKGPLVALPATVKAWLPAGAAGAAVVAIGLHAALGTCTQHGCLTPGYTPLLTAAAGVGLAGALARLRWPILTAATLTGAVLLLGEALAAGAVASLALQVVAAATIEGRPKKLTMAPLRLRLLVPFLLAGLVASWLAELVLDEALGLHTEGAGQELGASLAMALLLSAAIAAWVRERSLGFLAAAGGVAAVGVLLGWMGLFAWSMSGTDVVHDP